MRWTPLGPLRAEQLDNFPNCLTSQERLATSPRGWLGSTPRRNCPSRDKRRVDACDGVRSSGNLADASVLKFVQAQSSKIAKVLQTAKISLDGCGPGRSRRERRNIAGKRAHGVVVSHPLSMREALGSIPSVSMTFALRKLGFRAKHSQKGGRWDRFPQFPLFRGTENEPAVAGPWPPRCPAAAARGNAQNLHQTGHMV